MKLQPSGRRGLITWEDPGLIHAWILSSGWDTSLEMSMDHRQAPSMTQGQLPSRGLQLFQMQGTELLASPGKSFLPFLSLAVTSSSPKPRSSCCRPLCPTTTGPQDRPVGEGLLFTGQAHPHLGPSFPSPCLPPHTGPPA